MASTSNAPHFFKIVLHHTLRQGKLEVPDTFVKRNRRALLNTKVWLKLGNGAIWEVGLEKINGKIRFKYGWKEFMDFYSIKYGYLTVFRYEGSSCFHVLIFDKSGSEIQYPFQPSPVFCENEESDSDSGSGSGTDSDSDFQILEDISRKKVVMLQPTHPGSKRKRREKGKGKVQKEFKSKDLEVRDSPDCIHGRLDQDVIAQARVLKKATTFASKRKNPTFMVIMQVSYIVSGKKMGIPKSFSDMHIKESSMMVVRGSDGRSWDLKCQVRIVSDKHRKVELSSGWRRFVRDNNLQLGDICVFEWIESTKLSLEATIFRIS